ncbi:hypothetical protein [Chitinophaga pinensis]|uniref:DUF1571 domain-containing protein n=1 Tax=Chitinophaga pinensis (strain ATCC 43595 / DSM 2588 / LMG 13176 / NBRC 15968 / NCIMB 11800 / UQM 2034) TaxID=485918 RepID=A0A979G4E0_CHIPD|nr:hypothetical protein [Chitinophaga pinensis]ACU60579.1 hypothetical protein Cpin_3111 [Chitinophaga pinensis DSM 2588]
MIRTCFLLLCCTFLSYTGLQAQKVRISPANEEVLRKQQDSLQVLSDLILRGRDEAIRQNANDRFIPKLVQALKTPYSFYFRFDSLTTISIQYPADSAFRIFTWGLEQETSFYHHYGAIQMRTEGGELKLYPLFDRSDYINNQDTITNNKEWYGCMYYKVQHRRYFNKDYYTLFGWDANNIRSQKKMLDMLTFKDGEPVFGGPFFSFAEDTIPKKTRNRIILEYKKDATISLSYNPEMDMIVYDHLISETNQPSKPSTFVPDLDYEGFKWKAGKWMHIEKVFHDALPQGKVPVDQPMNQKQKRMMDPRTAEDINEGLQQPKKPKGKKQ